MNLKYIILSSRSYTRIRYFLILTFFLAILIAKYTIFTEYQSPIVMVNHNEIKTIVLKQAKSNLKVPIHPSLYSFGRIIIYHTGMFPRGGSGAMNYLHCALVSIGFNSFMHIPSDLSIPAQCSRFIASNFDATPRDIIVIPESAYFENVPRWRSSGGRIVIYMLGMTNSLAKQYHTNVLWAPSSTYTRDLYLATGKQVLFCPIEESMYLVQKQDLEKFNDTKKRTNIYKNLKSKENLIIIDDDSHFPSSLKAALTKLRLQPPVKLRVLSGISFSDVPSWLRRAKIVIDLGVVGVERINNEGALFDAIVLVANSLNGMDPIDFPIPNEFKLDTRNETHMLKIIKHCLVNYETLLPRWQALKQLTLDLPKRFVREDIPSYFSTRSFKFYIVTSSFDEESAVIPFALHCAVHFPLARIEVQVQNLTQFTRNHDMILKLLKEITNLSQDWLLLSERTGTNQPRVTNDSQFIISIDPRNMIVDEQLPHILVHLLTNEPALTLTSSCFGAAAQVIGDVTIWRSDSVNHSIPVQLLTAVNNYQTLLEEQLINIYAKRTKQEGEKGMQLASALYATQQQKLLQSMLPLAVPRFIAVMNEFEAIYPKKIVVE